MEGRAVAAVLVDFYGTLARATRWLSIQDVLAEHGYELSDEANRQWWMGLDGIEHLDHSRGPDHYDAWRRRQTLAMLSETDVHPGEHDLILQKLEAGRSRRVLEAYPEVHGALAVIRSRGIPIAVCSNWDWDLDVALAEAGLAAAVDVVVSSAWAGARKPHPRIFEHTLEKVGVPASTAVFVGDTWGPDVEGPQAYGMTAVYLNRVGHWPDATAPVPGGPSGDDVSRISDLRGLLALL
jgi:putative hydrolase of the HAD superfamily